MTSYQTGIDGENIACWFLRLKGYKIIAKRYKTPLGEIDIIAQRGKILAFIEVKRRKKLHEALEAAANASYDRISRAALWYLTRVEAQSDLRIDAIAMSNPFTLRHLRNVYEQGF